MNQLTPEQQAELQRLQAQSDARRAELTQEQRDDWRFRDPEMDRLFGLMFSILSGGKGSITLSADWVMAHGEEVK